MKGKKITIIGAGISGLATAHWLEKDGFDVTIIETGSEPGGSMITRFSEDFLIDLGPNSGLETTPLIKEIVKDVGLSKEMIYANEKGNKRYILKNEKLHPLPTSALKFVSSELFSASAKFRLLKEPFVGRSEDGYYQSIAEFVTRRLGKEFLENAIDPFVSGVFAGDPHKLSVKSAFPKLYRLEEEYGGLIKGMIKGAKERRHRNEESKQSAKMFSFKEGMQSFPKAIAKNISGNIFYDSAVKNISRNSDKIILTIERNKQTGEVISDVLLTTVPSHVLSKYFRDWDAQLVKHLNEIYYPPVLVLFAGYKKKSVTQLLDGFGFLIPSKEGKKFLGAIWSSVIFENRSPHESAAFTIFVGGARYPDFSISEVNDRINEVLEEFHEIMGITESPILLEKKFWKNAIPQYNLGYIEHEKYFAEFEKNNPGIFLGGNFRGGISVGDCIKSSHSNFEKIRDFLN